MRIKIRVFFYFGEWVLKTLGLSFYFGVEWVSKKIKEVQKK